METVTFQNPHKAYTLLNQWTGMETSYGTKFSGKDVATVDVLFEGRQPRFAVVHYGTDFSFGSEVIDLASQMLLDEPEKPALDFVLLNQE